MNSKKYTAYSAVMLLTVMSVFAVDISTGGGIDMSNTGMMVKIKTSDIDYTENLYFLGLHGFFDVHYITAELGFHFKAGNEKITNHAIIAKNNTMQLAYLNIAVLGKYPFQFGIVKFYPLLGLDFDFLLSGKINGKKIPSAEKVDYSRYYLSFGAGADVYIMKKLFVRPSVLFGIQLNQPEIVKTAQDAGSSGIYFGHKVTIGIGAGYTL